MIIFQYLKNLTGTGTERSQCRMKAERVERTVNHLVQCANSSRVDQKGVRRGTVDNAKDMLRVTGHFQLRDHRCVILINRMYIYMFSQTQLFIKYSCKVIKQF